MNDRLVWIDCEMTGLDLTSDALIEIACIVTDSELNALDDGIDVLIKPSAEALDGMDDVVRDMHTSSGLLAELGSGLSLAEAQDLVLGYVRQHVPESRKVPLCGNSIATDRGFLARDMPELDNFLHYRMVDVSSIKELARRWYPRVYFASPEKHGGHRALADIRESIRELHYYRDAVFVPQPGPDTTTARAIAARYGGPGSLPAAAPQVHPSCAQRVGPAAVTPHVDRAGLGDTSMLHAAARRNRRGLGGRSSVGRAPGCGPGCRGFKSRRSPRKSQVMRWPQVQSTTAPPVRLISLAVMVRAQSDATKAAMLATSS